MLRNNQPPDAHMYLFVCLFVCLCIFHYCSSFENPAESNCASAENCDVLVTEIFHLMNHITGEFSSSRSDE
jgi:hypothetical protein